jgi:hypothetical protein
MPSVSQKQHRFMEAVAHSPKFAREAGVSQSVGKDFARADDAAGITKTHPHRADGGPAPASLSDAAGGPLHPSLPHHSGFIVSDVPGRTDRLPRTVPADSFVIPADVVSIAGSGNSVAGAKMWGQILGMDMTPQAGGASGALATGGKAPKSEVILAGGEIVVPPEKVRQIGGGSISKGQAALRGAVKSFRTHEIARLKSAPPPKQ